MNMSSSAQPSYELPLTFSYRDVAAPALADKAPGGHGAHAMKEQATPGLSPQEVESLLTHARAEAIAETQKRLQTEMEARSAQQEAQTVQALEHFAEHQKNYFARLESEVVQLALAISARILHREAQVDPMLVAGLVHVALEKLQNGSNVTVRVSPQEAEKWREYTADLKKDLNITVAEDSEMQPYDCVLETDLGSADFSIDTQLKEVEQGFFDLLALRPATR